MIDIVESNEKIIQETRSFDADNNTTFSLRSKEEADDYRYFAEPDLTPFFITDNFLLQVKNSLPVLPEELENKYRQVFHLTAYDAKVICDDKLFADFFEEAIKHTSNYKAVANWLMGPIKSYLNTTNIEINTFSLSPKKIAALIQLVDDGKVNFSIASSKIFNALLNSPEKDPLQIATELNLLQESNADSLTTWVDEVIAKMPEKVKEYKSGKKGLIGCLQAK